MKCAEQSQTAPQPKRRLGTIKQFCAAYPFLSESAVRAWIFWDKNGFNSCVRRLGRKILIDYDQFERWIDDAGMVD